MSTEEKESVEQTESKTELLPASTEAEKKTSIGLTENVGGMLSYIFIIGIVFLFIEKENRFIRFHALQSIFLTIAVFLASVVLGFIPIIGWVANLLLGPLAFALVIFMMVQAYQGKFYKLPFIGELVEKQLDSV